MYLNNKLDSTLKLYFFLLFLTITVIPISLSAQFTEITTGLPSMFYNSVDWGDYDNDGDLDILVAGSTDSPSDPPISKIFRNNGNNTFTDINAGLTGVRVGSAVWGDYDNDGDLDILLAGENMYCEPSLISEVYRNDGNNIFTDISANLPGIFGTADWGDFDNDGDLDILLVGDTSNGAICKVYRNNGNNTFTDFLTGLTGVGQGSSFWGDYDNDGDLDILLSTQTASHGTKIYRNNGNNTFTSITTGLANIYGSVAWGDYDRDGDLDVLTAGSYDDGSGYHSTKVFRNNGNNTFTDINAGLPSVIFSSIDWGDYDNDGYLDILLTGLGNNSPPISIIYRNNGNGTFTDINAGLLGFYHGAVAWGDYDNDGDKDILLTGKTDTGDASKIYHNNGNSTFTDITDGLTYGIGHTIDWGDYDNDNDLDILMSGGYNDYTGSWICKSRIFRNNGNSSFTDIAVSLAGGYFGSITWGDYDNDNDLDILVSGETDDNIRVYQNNGNSIFSSVIVANVPGLYNCSASWGDYDNDGDNDILLLAYFGNDLYLSKIYRNNGNNSFTDIAANIPAGDHGVWGDYDNDGDLDILMTGPGFSSKIFRNDGNGVFVDIAAGLTDVVRGSCAWGDYDNDGDLDILLIGYSRVGNIAKVYRNDGNSSFFDIAADLPRVENGSCAWGDYDNDGNLDILLTGYLDTADDYITKVYRNEGTGIFVNISAGLHGIGQGTSVWGDYDNDGDLDILMRGFSDIGSITKLYRNDISNPNTMPTVPTNLRTCVVGDYIVFQWNASADDQTPSSGLSYNIRIGSTLEGNDISSPMSSSSGYRLIPVRGYVNGSCTWKILRTALPEHYYWSVQAVDTGFVGSPFAPEQTSPMTFPDINAGLSGVSPGSVAWGDYNNDGFLDILLSGQTTNSPFYISKIYRNNGDSTFTDINASLTGTWNGDVAWGDYDNDGDLDILLTGDTGITYISKIYRNDGNNIFTEISSGIAGVRNSSVAWGDFNNDGTLDILLTGQIISSQYTTKIYRNNGNSTFTDISADLPAVSIGSVAWGDYDNDGNLDILLTGQMESAEYISKIYHNNGDDTFTDIEAGLVGVRYSSVAWGDYDNNGSLDVLMTGHYYEGSNNFITKVYHNNGNSTFTDIFAGLQGVAQGSVAWGDYDNDGDLDILLTGSIDGISSTQIYSNNGNNSFVAIPTNLPNIRSSSVAWGDFDNDGDLDIVLTGRLENDIYISKVYRNNNDTSNSVPSPPLDLRTSVAGDYVIFQWDESSDIQTPSLGLNYSLRIGSTPGGDDTLSSFSDLDGTLLAPIFGYANSCFWKEKWAILPEHFYWSVQAVDGAFAGSQFASEIEYSLPPYITNLNSFQLPLGSVIVMEETDWSMIKVKNTGYANLTINNLHFRNPSSHFVFDYPNLSHPLAPNGIDTLYVKFSPTITGTIIDTLYIESNAVNFPVMKIKLTGTSLSVPPSIPQELNIAVQGINNNDVLIQWEPVITTTHGGIITTDWYFVYNSGNVEGPYTFLGYTNTTQYVHQGVGFGADHMFYRVKAIKFYTRMDDMLQNVTKGMTEAEVSNLINSY